METRPRAPRACRECPALDCDFTLKRVRFYLIVMRQARLSGEPFDVVLRSRTRSSRTIDPWVRSNVPDADLVERARAIGWAIEAAGRQHGIDPTNVWNAERLAALLCPERWDEGQV